MICPILNIEISSDDCFLTATVAEGITPKVDGVKEIIESAGFPANCLNCPHHSQ